MNDCMRITGNHLFKAGKEQSKRMLAAGKSVEWANPEVIPAKQRRLALLYISMTVLLWGVPFICTKTVLTDVPPRFHSFLQADHSPDGTALIIGTNDLSNKAQHMVFSPLSGILSFVRGNSNDLNIVNRVSPGACVDLVVGGSRFVQQRPEYLSYSAIRSGWLVRLVFTRALHDWTL